MHVVIVDNEPTILRSLEILIGPHAERVQCFADPIQALHYIEANGQSVDFLLVDYFMPDLNGLDLIHRSTPFLAPETVNIIISGHFDRLPPFVGDNSPIHYFFQKPLDLNQLFTLFESRRHLISDSPQNRVHKTGGGAI